MGPNRKKSRQIFFKKGVARQSIGFQKLQLFLKKKCYKRSVPFIRVLHNREKYSVNQPQLLFGFKKELFICVKAFSFVFHAFEKSPIPGFHLAQTRHTETGQFSVLLQHRSFGRVMASLLAYFLIKNKKKQKKGKLNATRNNNGKENARGCTS